MSVLVSDQRSPGTSGPRHLNPVTDLRAVADLIEEAFADELDQDSRQFLRELRQLSGLSPLLWMLKHLSVGFEDIINGFVWEENGEVVGNISVNRMGPVHAKWRISNVAVKPAYRNRGIGRLLVQTALDHVKGKGGTVAHLQVRDDNVPALRLYERFGFRHITAETEMVSASAPSEIPEPAFALRLRPLRPGEQYEVCRLVRAATPPGHRQLNPIHEADFETDWLQNLIDAVTTVTSGRKTYRLVAEGETGMSAYVQIVTAGWGKGAHRINLHIHPLQPKEVQQAVVHAALKMLRRHRDADTEVKLHASKHHEIEALESLGFHKRRTLVTMELHLDE